MFSAVKNSDQQINSNMNLLLLSGSKAAGNLPEGTQPGLLDFAETWIKDFFANAVKENKPVLFVPYARPGGISEEDYFNTLKHRMDKMGIQLICAPANGITENTLENIGGIFVGGGHTYTLLDKLQKTGSLELIRQKVMNGLPYLGTSAGTVIACPTIKTTNDMPGLSADVIDLRSLGFINTQINCHYMDNAMHDTKHQGETRDTRIKEFCAFNPNINVFGLYEGTALRIANEKTYLFVSEQARGTKSPVFCNDKRTEIECKIGEKKDVSQFFYVTKNHEHAATRTLK